MQKLVICSFFSLLLFVMVPISALAFEHWHVSTEKEIKSLIVTNRKSQAQVLWISGPIKGLPTDPDQKLEIAFTIEPLATLEIPLLDFKHFPWVHLKTAIRGNLLVSARTRFEQEVLIQAGSSNRWSARARPNSELILMNLAPFEQKIKVSDLNPVAGQELLVEVPAFASVRNKLPAWSAGKTVVIEGTARIQGFLLNEHSSQSFSLSREPSSIQPAKDKVYFRLSNVQESSSYIVGLTDESMITQARDQITQGFGQPGPWLPRILVAQIDYGSNQENRDFTKAGSPLWSWNINQVFNFSQLAHQDCDGSPEMLEELLQVWRQGSRVICFWNYHVVEQISLESLQKGERIKPTPLSKHPVPLSLQP